MQVTATKSTQIIILELLHGNTFSAWEDIFVNPFGSDVIGPNQLYIGTGAGQSTCSGTIRGFPPGKYNCFVNPLLVFVFCCVY